MELEQLKEQTKLFSNSLTSNCQFLINNIEEELKEKGFELNLSYIEHEYEDYYLLVVSKKSYSFRFIEYFSNETSDDLKEFAKYKLYERALNEKFFTNVLKGLE